MKHIFETTAVVVPVVAVVVVFVGLVVVVVVVVVGSARIKCPVPYATGHFVRDGWFWGGMRPGPLYPRWVVLGGMRPGPLYPRSLG